MDDDPSDGKMAVWGGRNMELSMDEFAVTGTDKPNNYGAQNEAYK